MQGVCLAVGTVKKCWYSLSYGAQCEVTEHKRQEELSGQVYIWHGERKIKHKIIWFLSDIKDFTERKLYIFEYFTYQNKQLVKKTIALLSEKNILSGRVFTQKEKGKNALKIIEKEKARLLYTSDDIKITKGKPHGWTYGENREIHNAKGEIIEIRQYRCDFHGQKELC